MKNFSFINYLYFLQYSYMLNLHYYATNVLQHIQVVAHHFSCCGRCGIKQFLVLKKIIDDLCVKIIEKVEAEERITRDCLSSLEGIQNDIPADKYEGCRISSLDVKLGHYVNNSIPKLDIKRDYYDQLPVLISIFFFFVRDIDQ
ncbi:unnamed protein product [Macrosiphum euphorbiae]|uniref:Uncharacterized protein n=1 Tax=Macrosiphum euphorbiae TaxID=13131 RepID=A0AAV0WFX5_9HEMI|nr:unnamed protein product [Macrosiphum euphorbiae]